MRCYYLEPAHVEEEAKKPKYWHIKVDTDILVVLTWVKILPCKYCNYEVKVDCDG